MEKVVVVVIELFPIFNDLDGQNTDCVCATAATAAAAMAAAAAAEKRRRPRQQQPQMYEGR